MARRILALIVGLTVFGVFTYFLTMSKEAGIEVNRVEPDPGQPASLPVLIVASSDGALTVEGRPVELAALSDEVARIIAAAEEASLPEPTFVIAVPDESDNMLLITIMESLAQGGASSIAIDTVPADQGPG